MCGIYGYVGANAVSQTLNGIKRLEYRGYDSSGIAFVTNEEITGINYDEIKNNVTKLNGGIFTIKEKGEISKLENILKKLHIKSNLAIGHTRWATHGKPSVNNSHPQWSENGQWVIVHNGIIENFLELKNSLSNVKFNSETDTEVVAQMLEKNFNGNILETIRNVCNLVVGSFAFLIMHSSEPNKVYVAKRNSPVVVGVNTHCGIVCSDINSIRGAKDVFVLDNDQYAVVEKGKATFYNNNLEVIKINKVKNHGVNTDNILENYDHFMIKEICEIPKAIEKTVAEYNTFNKLKRALPKKLFKNVKHILIVACGTAYHAGLMGKKLFEEQNGIKTTVEIASEFRYSKFVPHKNTLAIFVSQSGETADTIKAVQISKSYGLKTIAITNVKNSSITFEVDYCVYTMAGAEISVASTKAYNCQVAMFYLLSAYINAIKSNNQNLVFEESNKLIEVANIIKNNDILDITREIANDIKDSKSTYMIGRNIDYYIALEASLKLKEISYIHSEAYPAGELKHGTISLIDNNTFVFAFITQELIKEKTYSNVYEVISRGGKIIMLSQFDLETKGMFKFVKLPEFDEKYLSLITIVYMQLIAYYTSLFLGHNPDKPRSLAKSVTVE